MVAEDPTTILHHSSLGKTSTKIYLRGNIEYQKIQDWVTYKFRSNGI